MLKKIVNCVFGGMEELSVRRSLRVAGMTPLKPMSSILFEEQERTRGRGRSGSATPRRTRDAALISHGIPDSRARQILNLPSDISSSDFLGDTPTARFHRANNFHPTGYAENLATAVARRTMAGTGAAAVAPGPRTVRARRITKQNSSVFLRQEEGSIIGFVLFSLVRLLWCIPSLVQWAFVSLLLLPSFAARTVQTVQSSKPLIFSVLAASALVVSYALLQLDWKIAAGIGSSLLARPKGSAPEIIDVSSRINSNDLFVVNKNLKGIREQILSVEASTNEAKAAVAGMEKNFKVGMGAVAENERTLEQRIATLSKEIDLLRERSASASEFHDIKVQIEQLHLGLQQSSRAVLDLRERTSLDALKLLVKHELVDLLPENLLVRLNQDGSIYLDPSLLQLLQDLLLSRGEHASGAGTTSNTTIDPAINAKAIESLLNGRLSQLEHRLVHKNQVVDLINSELASKLASFSVKGGSEWDSLFRQVEQKLASVELQLRTSALSPTGASEIARKQIQQAELSDGVGMADFALLSMGSRVIASLTSPTFRQSGGFLSELFQIRSKGKPPKVALIAENSLGNCWAFRGSLGSLVVALGVPIIPTHFSIDHVPAGLQVDRSSAPKRFKVFGLNSPRDSDFLLGQYEYRLDGTPVQTFAAQFLPGAPVKLVKLVILDNHGREDYTCLYRFRVHSVDSSSPKAMYGDMQ